MEAALWHVTLRRNMSAAWVTIRGDAKEGGVSAVGDERYLSRMRVCARAIGKEFREPSLVTRERRLAATDVDLVERGVLAGLIRIDGNYVVTQDPWQGTAWLVERPPAPNRTGRGRPD
jgi:hypothetical protein